jgi:predicted solute-binding protein
LNTVPLIWGFTHGAQQNVFDLTLSVPAECADQLSSGAADIGIVPCAELPRLGLSVVPGLGIACRGPVRSILLVSRVAPGMIRTLAADAGSRTSVMLARIVLKQRFGVMPVIRPHPPVLDAMLAEADAALIIGDPALALDPSGLPHHVLDLGAEWVSMTGLPMVFAVWAGRENAIAPNVVEAFHQSARYGLARIDEIAAWAERERGISERLAREYLTRHIAFDIGERELEGMELFLRYVREFDSFSTKPPADTLEVPEEEVPA